jgi:multidrug efflux pump subunit AcrA (membrane-fusion protein)
MFTSSLILTVAMAVGQADAQAALTDPVDENCTLSAIADVQVPAEESGALASLEVREGMYVKEDMELGHIDYREAQAALDIKQYDLELAKFKANSKVSVKYAEKAADVAKQIYKRYQLANKDVTKAVAETEMLRYKLEAEKAILGTQKELEAIEEALLTSKSKGAEVEAARISLAKRTFHAPFDGVVVKVFRQVGEWVAPGEPVFRIVRIDRLRVSARLDASMYSHSDVDGRPVTVEVSLPRGRKVQVEGKIVSVSPIVDLGGKTLSVTAEIETPMENGRPVVRVNQRGSLTVHVNGQVTGAAKSEPPKPGKKTS